MSHQNIFLIVASFYYNTNLTSSPISPFCPPLSFSLLHTHFNKTFFLSYFISIIRTCLALPIVLPSPILLILSIGSSLFSTKRFASISKQIHHRLIWKKPSVIISSVFPSSFFSSFSVLFILVFILFPFNVNPYLFVSFHIN